VRGVGEALADDVELVGSVFEFAEHVGEDFGSAEDDLNLAFAVGVEQGHGDTIYLDGFLAIAKLAEGLGKLEAKVDAIGVAGDLTAIGTHGFAILAGGGVVVGTNVGEFGGVGGGEELAEIADDEKYDEGSVEEAEQEHAEVVGEHGFGTGFGTVAEDDGDDDEEEDGGERADVGAPGGTEEVGAPEGQDEAGGKQSVKDHEEGEHQASRSFWSFMWRRAQSRSMMLRL
jgi:hypothetical protein